MTAKTAHSTDKIEDALVLLREAAHDKKEEVEELLADKYADLRETIAGYAHSAADRAIDFSVDAQRYARRTAKNIDRHVHHDPWPVLGVSALTALIVGYLLGRKD